MTVEPGVVNQDFDINPLDDATLEGNETITCTVAAGAGYAVGTNSPSANATMVDDELPAETVLWSDDFNTDTSASWITLFGTTNGAPEDYRAVFNYDYAAFNWIPGLPPAPHSP